MSTKNLECEITLVQGDTCPKLEFEINDKDDNPINLLQNERSVRFFLRRACSDKPVNCSGFETTLVSGEANNNVVCYLFNEADLAEPGTYFGDVQLVEAVSGVTCDPGVSGFCTETAGEPLRILVRSRNSNCG